MRSQTLKVEYLGEFEESSFGYEEQVMWVFIVKILKLNNLVLSLYNFWSTVINDVWPFTSPVTNEHATGHGQWKYSCPVSCGRPLFYINKIACPSFLGKWLGPEIVPSEISKEMLSLYVGLNVFCLLEARPRIHTSADASALSLLFNKFYARNSRY
jgi:hypothetical protein